MGKDFYIENYQLISKSILILLFSSLVINVYLIQRGSDYNYIIQEKIIDVGEKEGGSIKEVAQDLYQLEQGSYMGLRVNYTTLSIIFPLMLLTLYFLVGSLFSRAKFLMERFRCDFQDIEISSLRYTVYSIFYDGSRLHKIIYFIVLFVVPSLGFISHSISGFETIAVIDSVVEVECRNNDCGSGDENLDVSNFIENLKFLFLLQAISSLFFLFLSIFMNVRSMAEIKLISRLYGGECTAENPVDDLKRT